MNLWEKRVGSEIKSVLCDHKQFFLKRSSQPPWLNTETESAANSMKIFSQHILQLHTVRQKWYTTVSKKITENSVYYCLKDTLTQSISQKVQ